MFKFLKKIFGTKHDRDVQGYQPIVNQINQYYSQYQSLSNDELRQKTTVFKKRITDYLSEIDGDLNNLREKAVETDDIAEKESLFKEIDAIYKERNVALEDVLKQILPEAFAVVKETARRFSENESIEVTATDHDRELAATKNHVLIDGDRAFWKNSWTAAGGDVTWNMVHYDVQLVGGMVLHDGKIAEMATGEGKTLVSTLPSYLNALAGEGVHIVTVNEYLARRDAEWNGPLYEFLLLKVDCIDRHRPNSEERRRAYLADITYGTNSEFGFDYLRDNMVTSPDELVQRKHHYAVVDEVDSVLIDDARTPLIISGPVPFSTEEQEYVDLKPQIERLIEAQRRLATEYLTEARKLFKDKILGVEEGEAGLALLRAYRALPKNRPLIKFLSEEGVKVALQKAENHYMQEQSKHMRKVDVTLFFTIDEKNRNVELTDKGSEFLARGSDDPHLFTLPNVAEKMVEIERNKDLSPEEKKEAKQRVAQDFAIKSKRLHAVSQLLKAYTLFENDEEYVVLDGEVKIVDEQTGRIMEGRRYSDGLHQAIEAKENVKVGEHTQTYATVTLQNYFRMFHKLAGMTGTAETEAKELWEIYKLDVVVIPTNRKIVRKDVEDLVYKTTREKYNAVIDEIVHLSQAGRPVLVGTTSVDISEKLSRMLQLRGIKHNVLNAKQHQREAEIVAEAGQPGAVTLATNMAGRGTDIKLGTGVKEAGGLAIVGTERHESRRVDRQLRGRSGRQGDPGTSQFFISLEDNLMRLFQSERIAGLMDKMGHKEGEVIQHSMVTKSIERAQTKVEENNFGIRKRLLEYDDVMNIQREAIYKKRRNALSGDRLAVDLHTMFSSLTENMVAYHRVNGTFDTFHKECLATLGFEPEIDVDTFKTSKEDDLIDNFQQQFFEFYEHKSHKIAEDLMPIVRHVYETEGHRYKRILIPFTDGSAHPLPIAAELEDAVNSNGRTIMRDIEKTVTLSLIDDEWKEHLRSMDELKESVQAASFEQKDPLVIYKMEAYQLFEELVHKINTKVSAYLSQGMLVLPEEQPQPNPQQRVQAPPPMQILKAPNQSPQQPELRTNREEELLVEAEEVGGNTQSAKGQNIPPPQKTPQTPLIRQEKKVGRNDLCPCGSGKKYKHCHGS